MLGDDAGDGINEYNWDSSESEAKDRADGHVPVVGSSSDSCPTAAQNVRSAGGSPSELEEEYVRSLEHVNGVILDSGGGSSRRSDDVQMSSANLSKPGSHKVAGVGATGDSTTGGTHGSPEVEMSASTLGDFVVAGSRENREKEVRPLPDEFWNNEDDPVDAISSGMTALSVADPLGPKNASSPDADGERGFEFGDAASAPSVRADTSVSDLASGVASSPDRERQLPSIQEFLSALQPRMVHTRTRIFELYPSKRISLVDSNEVEVVFTYFKSIRISYRHLATIFGGGRGATKGLSGLERLISMKGASVDDVIGMISPSAGSQYAKSAVAENCSAERTNEIMKMFFAAPAAAVRKALELGVFSLAYFMAVQARAEIGDELYTRSLEAYVRFLNPGVSAFFLGNVGDDWRESFAMLLRRPNGELFAKLAQKLSGADLYFVLISFHLVHNYEVDSHSFFNNFYLLDLILTNNIEIKNIDALIVNCIIVLREGGMDKLAGRVLDKYSRMIRKEYKAAIGKDKSGWIGGLRSVFDKGMMKIVGEEVVAGGKSALPKPSPEISAEPQNVGPSPYPDRKLSQSYADFFDNDTYLEESQYINAIPRGYELHEDNADEKEAEKSAQRQGIFSRINNIFSRKKNAVPRVELKTDDDFKYDPVTRKWITGGEKKCVDPPSTVSKVEDIPMPSANVKISGINTGDDISSRYGNVSSIKTSEKKECNVEDLLPTSFGENDHQV